jgi:hypothetical protein
VPRRGILFNVECGGRQIDYMSCVSWKSGVFQPEGDCLGDDPELSNAARKATSNRGTGERPRCHTPPSSGTSSR